MWFPFVNSNDQLVDTLKKTVSSKNFYNSLDKSHIRDIYAPNCGEVLAWAVNGWPLLIIEAHFSRVNYCKSHYLRVNNN